MLGRFCDLLVSPEKMLASHRTVIIFFAAYGDSVSVILLLCSTLYVQCWWFAYGGMIPLFLQLLSDKHANTPPTHWFIALSIPHLIILSKAFLALTGGTMLLRASFLVCVLFTFLIAVHLCLITIHSLCRFCYCYSSPPCSPTIMSPLMKLLIQVIVLFVLFLSIEGPWLPLETGYATGYPLCSPLLPLIASKYALRILLYLPYSWTLFLFLGAQAATAYACLMLAWSPLIMSSLLWLLFLIPAWLPHREPVHPAWLNSIAVIEAPYEKTTHSTLLSEMVHKDITCITREHPNLTCIIFPESSFYDAHDVTSLLHATTSHKKNIIIIAGAIKQHQTGMYNSIFLIQQGKVEDSYDKRLLLPCIERMPISLLGTAYEQLFTRAQGIFQASRAKTPTWTLSENQRVVPLICAELFCGRKPDAESFGCIIAFCNSIWAGPLFRKLMKQYAQLRAYSWHVDILYVNNHDTSYFTAQGESFTPIRVEHHLCAAP